MKKALSRLRPFGSFLILASLLTGALTVIRHHASAHNSIKSVVVSSEGQKLTTLFEGLSPDPRYSVKDILATRRALPRCGKNRVLCKVARSPAPCCKASLVIQESSSRISSVTPKFMPPTVLLLFVADMDGGR